MRSSILPLALAIAALLIAHAPAQPGAAFAQGSVAQGSVAQGARAQAADRPAELMTAPNSPNQKAEPATSDRQQGRGQAANICRELVAFLQQQSSTANGSRQGTAAAKPATDSAAPGGQTAQSVDRPQQNSGQVAPVPTAQPSTAPTQISLEDAKALAEANDLPKCRDRTRDMRLAGVALPPGLLALAALREDLLLAAGK
jgi:hypothetical protein